MVAHLRDPDGRPHYGAASNEVLYAGLEQLYRQGQSTGEFGAFDVRMMAITQQAATDAMFSYWALHPEHDLTGHAAALADFLIRAIERR